ncbi:hypothetical protein GCM10010964_32850 [Caldovatus sediminis]|uniref:NADH:quinone oxidoreductase/Mrp antiporter transmembrane domain-containing protein n=1 Tax=Caldovatus sediminis TaxID=2041189 RepID=A0A8J2ZDH9_9PROT|nr:proton-conducting transporter membrane subunit [Caldovatus sediminis]GGG42789.1 hypothetical protein GCM10010964_32850 [Caldovatus sediminis]
MLTALALLLLALPLLAAAAPLLARQARGEAAVHAACCGAGAFLALSGLAALLVGETATLTLPIGPPWGPLRLALDGLSAWFLLPLGLCAAAASLAGPGIAGGGRAALPRLAAPPLLLAGMALGVLAADGFALLLGLGIAALAAALPLAAAGPVNRMAGAVAAAPRREARALLLAAGGGAFCLAAALGFAAAAGGAAPALAADFPALRARPPEGWPGAAVLLLVLIGVLLLTGLLPGHRRRLPPALAVAGAAAVRSGPVVGVLLLGAMPALALYAAARLLLDLGGPAQPPWWGVPPLLAGAALALAGALRAAVVERDADAVVAALSLGQGGLALAAFGLAAGFRAADLGPLAALAAGAGLLHALHLALAATLLALVAQAVRRGAGSRRLDRLGGLARTMPRTAGFALFGAAALAALPPFSGFAAQWLLFQALFASWRVADAGFQLAAAGAAALGGLAAACTAAALLRLYGLAFLGPPRTPRAAGAEEAGGVAGIAALGLPAAGVALLGLFPGALLTLGDPALRLLAGASVTPRVGPLAVTLPGAGEAPAAAHLAPLAVAVLLGLAALALAFVLRRTAAGAAGTAPVRAPVWNGGAMAPPPHLPFGDPAAQPGAAGMAQPLRRAFPLLPSDPRPATLRAAPAPAQPGPFARLAGRLRPVLPALAAAPALLRLEAGHPPLRRAVGRLFALLLALLAAALALRPNG